MSVRRPTSLLDFAIAATLAILPVMLGIVLLVAVIRPADPGTVSWRGAPERYVSVRHVAALKTFERAIVERSALTLAAPTVQQLLDGLPQCRPEWDAPWRASRWLSWLPVAPRSASASQAEKVAAQLAAFDAALLRFATRPNPRVAQPLGFDAARWFREVGQRMDSALESAEYPGRQFQLRCSDLATALAALLEGDARMLDAFTWRGSAGGTLLARWRADQQVEIAPQHVARRNPWSGIAGCIYLGHHGARDGPAGPSHFVAGARSSLRRLCPRSELAGVAPAASASATGVVAVQALAGEPGPADPVDDTRWMVPPSLHTLLQPLEALRQPTGALYQAYAGAEAAGAAPARIVLDGSSVEMGLSIDLTIDPVLQGLAQRTAACYTGRHEVCRALGLRRRDDQDQPLGSQLLEGAMVRMAAVAVIDVASGRIEALAGALSRCARQEVDGPGRDAACDTRLPYPVQYRPDALLNPAVFHDAMPASTIKPIMAAAFLSDPEVGARWMAAERVAMPSDAPPARNSLRSQLLRSDSARFLDRMFCLDHDAAACGRPWAVQSMASAFGWNAGCDAAAAGASRLDCGKHELLFGGAIDATRGVAPARPRPLKVAYGRLMSEPRGGKVGAPMQLMPYTRLDAGIVRRCAEGADGRRQSDDDWEKCRGGAVVDVVAEGWGQGHARASALGIAGMMATLAAAANGQTEVHRPHLVDGVRAAGGTAPPALGAALAQWRQGALQPNRISTGAADLILNALAYSHRIGTARTACEQVFDPARCRSIGWLAGKTGTPSFPHDGLTLDELAQLCPHGVAAPAAKPGSCSSLRPYKWYVAAYRSDQGTTGPWNKVIAVLTERNWVQRTGQVHGSGDHGPNPAAEIALQITGRQLGLLTGAAP
jgi:hypothetical protein